MSGAEDHTSSPGAIVAQELAIHLVIGRLPD